jgi:hypothetical protein
MKISDCLAIKDGNELFSVLAASLAVNWYHSVEIGNHQLSSLLQSTFMIVLCMKGKVNDTNLKKCSQLRLFSHLTRLIT